MKILPLMIILVLLNFNIAGIEAAGNSFSPWDADVKIGDENIKSAASAKNIPAQRISTVYSAPQGGAYFMIRFFQVVISPQDGPHCRFHPTCSAYGRHAVERFGGLIGGMMAGDRIIRCNPYNPPGDDPVPIKLFQK